MTCQPCVATVKLIAENAASGARRVSMENMRKKHWLQASVSCSSEVLSGWVRATAMPVSMASNNTGSKSCPVKALTKLDGIKCSKKTVIPCLAGGTVMPVIRWASAAEIGRASCRERVCLYV